jgi:cellulose synthase/poly-beta-1,6-N-acetylglucosamine synthase-like glycosyltransferase
VAHAVLLETLYWSMVGCVVYPYLVYPALLACWARLRPRPVHRSPRTGCLPTVSVVISAYNESHFIKRRVEEFLAQIAAGGLTGEVVVVSDGSTDGTAEIARSLAGGAVPVTVLDFGANFGKASALSAGCKRARGEVIAFADARQTWAPDALTRLLENFADPDVGAVGGTLAVETAPGVIGGVGLYWRYETLLRRMEGLVGSTVGVSGSICAVRRALFRPIPAGTVLDDVYWPLQVVMLGRRVVFDSRARAFDRLPEGVAAEFRRKVRTLSGNFQLVARLPESLVPWENPAWFALVSHKLMRLAVPWALLLTAVLAAARGGPVYSGLFAAQAAAALLGLAGMMPAVAARSRAASAAASFLVLNTAAWVGFWVWATGRTSQAWNKTAYRPASAKVALPRALERVAR